MPRRLLLPLAALALAAALSAGCSDTVSPAIRIGDTSVSHDDLMAEVEEWAGNDATQAAQDLAQSGTAHGFASGPTSQIIGERILLALFEDEFDRQGLEITDDDRANALALVGIDPAQEEQLLGGFSDEYRATYLDRWAKVAAVQAVAGEDLRTIITEGAADVDLSPRYGTWDAATLVVTPPVGPAAEVGDSPALAPAAP